MTKIILGLTSQMAGGKETVKKYLEKNYQAQSCRFSSILRDILNRLFLDNSRDNIQNLSTSLRKVFGEDILALTITKEVSSIKANIIVVDGVRRFADIKYLKELSNFFLISIEADPKIRYNRLVSRAENPGDKEKTFAYFLADHQKEADREIPKVMETANYIINNNHSLENLYQQIDKIIEKIQNK